MARISSIAKPYSRAEQRQRGRMARREMRRIAPELGGADGERFRVRRLDDQQPAADAARATASREEREERIDRQVLDDVHRHDGADRAIGDVRETSGTPATDASMPARDEIGDRALVRIEAARGDARVAAGDQKLAAPAADVDQRLCSCASADVIGDVDRRRAARLPAGGRGNRLQRGSTTPRTGFVTSRTRTATVSIF